MSKIILCIVMLYVTISKRHSNLCNLKKTLQPSTHNQQTILMLLKIYIEIANSESNIGSDQTLNHKFGMN